MKHPLTVLAAGLILLAAQGSAAESAPTSAAVPATSAVSEPVAYPRGCRFDGPRDEGWELAGDLGTDEAVRARPWRFQESGRKGRLDLTRRIGQLPLGSYRVVFTGSVTGGSEVQAWIEAEGQRKEIALTPGEAPATVVSETVATSDGSLRFGISYIAAGDGVFRPFALGLQRCARSGPGAPLRFAGVTPYSKPGMQFQDGRGADHGSFIELARAAGANAVRTLFQGDDPAWAGEAALIRRLGMRNLCTLLPPTPPENATFAECRTHLETWCRQAMATFQRRGVVPDLLFIGNEVNTDDGRLNRFAGWHAPTGKFVGNIAQTLSGAVAVIRQAGYRGPIGMHFDRPWADGFAQVRAAGFQDFQVAAFSLYPKRFHPGYTMESGVRDMAGLAASASLDLLVLETAAPYTDRGGKLASQDCDPACVAEISPAGQTWHLRRVCDLMQGVPDGRGLGVITWGSDLTWGVYPWDHVTWNRAQVTPACTALPSLAVFGEYAAR